MALNYITVGISLIILVFYVAIFLILILINRRLEGSVRTTFFLLMIGVTFLILRRIEYIFSNTGIISIPYFRDSMSLLFAIILSFATYNFYNSITKIASKKRFRNPLDRYRNRKY